MKEHKQCCVRIPEELHRWAKLAAYASGRSLQEYICDLIEEERKIAQENKKNTDEK